jgi:phage tail tape-measure protein
MLIRRAPFRRLHAGAPYRAAPRPATAARTRSRSRRFALSLRWIFAAIFRHGSPEAYRDNRSDPMKRSFVAGASVLVLAMGLTACTNPYDPGQRALGGAAIGAGSGAAIGAIAGGGRGAAIGALAGGALGAVAGAATTPQPPPGYYTAPPGPGYYVAPPPPGWGPPPGPGYYYYRY